MTPATEEIAAGRPLTAHEASKKQPVAAAIAPGTALDTALDTGTSREAENDDMPLPHNPQTIFLGVLCVFATLAVLRVSAEVALPVVIALVLKLLLQPLVRLMERIRVPKALGALVSVVLLLGLFGVLGTILSRPATQMVRDAPALVEKLQNQVQSAHGFVDRLKPMLEPLGLSGDTGSSASEMIKNNAGAVAGAVAAGASSFVSHLLETLLILFYMLVFGETFMRRLVEVLPRFRDKKQAVEISATVERDISAYLLTITVINAVVGVLAGCVMWLFGVPGAIVWGVVAFCLNFIPILGPFCGVALFAAVGLATLGGAWASLLPAVAYLAIHFAEGELFTPMLLAKRFTLNPIAVMIALIFWYWMWGVQGAILSVPILAITKIVSDRLRPFRALGHLLEG